MVATLNPDFRPVQQGVCGCHGVQRRACDPMFRAAGSTLHLKISRAWFTFSPPVVLKCDWLGMRPARPFTFPSPVANPNPCGWRARESAPGRALAARSDAQHRHTIWCVLVRPCSARGRAEQQPGRLRSPSNSIASLRLKPRACSTIPPSGKLSPRDPGSAGRILTLPPFGVPPSGGSGRTLRRTA